MDQADPQVGRLNEKRFHEIHGIDKLSRHVGDSLIFMKYHGPRRPKDVDSLSKADVVITTYHTLAVEYQKKRSLLHTIHWFRVVLDEGKHLFLAGFSKIRSFN